MTKLVKNNMLVCLNEVRTKEDIDNLVDEVGAYNENRTNAIDFLN